MEYERKHWLRSSVPTGYKNMAPHSYRPKAICESEYDNLKNLRDKGVKIDEIARMFGCSAHTIRTTIKHIDSLT